MSQPTFSLYPGSGQLGPLPIFTTTTKTTAGPLTLTVPQLINGLWERDPNGASRTDTTPTAIAIANAIPGAIVGTGFLFFVRNNGSDASSITIAAGTGVTITGSAVISQGQTVLFIGKITLLGGTAATVTLERAVDGGTPQSTQSLTAGITAFAGGGQGSATALASNMNEVTTVATQGDSVALPAATAGKVVTVLNRGAFPMQVFGAGTDTINGIATATGVSQGVNTTAVYRCSVAGNWEIPIKELFSYSPVALTTNGAVSPDVPQTYVVTKAGVLADTLAAPAAASNGLRIRIFSDTANAHTLTATGLLDTGSASVNLATFAAQKGAGLTLIAYNARWKVESSVGITFS